MCAAPSSASHGRPRRRAGTGGGGGRRRARPRRSSSIPSVRSTRHAGAGDRGEDQRARRTPPIGRSMTCRARAGGVRLAAQGHQQEEESHGLPTVRDGDLRGDAGRAPLGGAGALQHRPRRVRQARRRSARDGLGGLAGHGAAGQLRRAEGVVESLRQRTQAHGVEREDRVATLLPSLPETAAAFIGTYSAARHLAVALRSLRGRRHPASPDATQERRSWSRTRPTGTGSPAAWPRPCWCWTTGFSTRWTDRAGGVRHGGGRHCGRRPGAALLLVGHNRQGQGDPPRPPLSARARGVRVLPRRTGRRAVPRLGRMGLGRRDRAPARPVALRRRGPRPGPQGRVRPRGPPALPLQARGGEHVHDAHRAAGHDGR